MGRLVVEVWIGRPGTAGAGVAVVLIAGGRRLSADRAPDVATLEVAGRSLLARCAQAVVTHPAVIALTVVCEPADRVRITELLAREVPGLGSSSRPLRADGTRRRAVRRGPGGIRVATVPARPTPAESLHRGILTHVAAVAAGRVGYLCVHDAAHPLASRHLVHEVLAAAQHYGAAVPSLAPPEEVWVDDHGRASRYPLDRPDVVLQSPQAFAARDLIDCYGRERDRAYPSGSPTEVWERGTGRRVHAVPGESRNLRVDAPASLFAAADLLSRTGFVDA